MFTGIIEEVGEVKAVKHGAKSAVLTIKGKTVLEHTKVGDSIAVNGVCLTVTSLADSLFTADVMAESMRRTALGALSAGSRVNLERAMPADGRFGGHIVSGHIDGTGKIRSVQREDNAVWIEVAADEKIMRYIIEKGSVTLDGISLTVAYVDESCFCVSIIPHTQDETTLSAKKAGDVLNIENDVIAKYVEKLLGKCADGSDSTEQKTGTSKVDAEFLARHGYL